MNPDEDDQLIHDIAVPRYSTLGTVTPNRIVLIGVYLLFIPGVLYCLLIIPELLRNLTISPAFRLLLAAAYAIGAAVCILIIYKTHKRYRTAKRIATGFCGHCGYDLRASHHHCPECGTDIEEEAEYEEED